MSDSSDRGAADSAGHDVRRVAWVLLVVLAVVLPFEAPLFSLGPLVITTSELCLYAAMAAWGVSLLIETSRSLHRRPAWLALEDAASVVRDPVARAVAIWLAVTVVAALAAPSHRGQALKAAARASSGTLIYFVARDLARAPARARVLAAALVTGATLFLLGRRERASAPIASSVWLSSRGAGAAVGLAF